MLKCLNLILNDYGGENLMGKKNRIKSVGALTVIQPWAHIILHKGKNVENRQKNSHFRGTVAIHASSTNSKAWFDDCPIPVDREDVPFGTIVGFAELVDVITKKGVSRKTKKWFSGKYGYVLRNVIALKNPVHTKGARGVWVLKGRTLAKCLNQLSSGELKRLKPFEKIRK